MKDPRIPVIAAYVEQANAILAGGLTVPGRITWADVDEEFQALAFTLTVALDEGRSGHLFSVMPLAFLCPRGLAQEAASTYLAYRMGRLDLEAAEADEAGDDGQSPAGTGPDGRPIQ